MIEKIISETTYKRFIIQQVFFSGGEAVMRGVPATRSPASFEHWRIIAKNGNPHRYITAESHEVALQKIDSGEAHKLLS